VIGPEPIALGVKVTEQLADAPDPVSVHGLPLKPPARSELKLTVPLGVLVTPPSVSVTVAVHVVGWPASTSVGEQLTSVDVENGGGV
jgi:hypothetical protein